MHSRWQYEKGVALNVSVYATQQLRWFSIWNLANYATYYIRLYSIKIAVANAVQEQDKRMEMCVCVFKLQIIIIFPHLRVSFIKAIAERLLWTALRLNALIAMRPNGNSFQNVKILIRNLIL